MTYDSELDFENALVSLLTKKCGWNGEVLRYPTEDDLIQNWADILYRNNRSVDKLGDYPLTRGEMDQIIEQIRELRTPYNLNSFINGKTVAIKRDNPEDKDHFGKEVSLHIYDRQEIAGGKSCYQIAEQPRFRASEGAYPSRRGDVMLLINGMPLFHIELKRSGIPVSRACNQIEKYSREGVYSGIFALVQIFVAMTPEEALYFTNPGPDGRFDKNFFFRWADFDNIPVKDWEEFTRKLLFIPMAHQLIGFYTVPDGKDGTLKVLRSYQYYAVAEIENRVAKNDWDEREQRGGYVWHTTGSGKTLTSFKAADLMAKSRLADKVVFLVDRIELDGQALRCYRYFADDEVDVQGTDDTGDLVAKMKSPDPADTLIVTSIQKMSRIYGDGDPGRRRGDTDAMNGKRIVFIVDECHRDTFGEMMYKVKRTFPGALFFGFTGTPIKEENAKKGCTSEEVFGDELHRYTIGDGIRDGNVLAFDHYMVSTFKDDDVRDAVIMGLVHAGSMDEMFADPGKTERYYELRDGMPMAGHRDGSGDYVKGIEDFIPASQYETDGHMDAVVGDVLARYRVVSHDRKFHSIFATSSIREAIGYYRRFKDAAPDLRVTVLVDPSDDNGDGDAEKLEGIAEVIGDYNARYGTDYTIPTYRDMKKDVSARMSHDAPYRGVENDPGREVDMLIVVDQMLTGFDSKWVNALYLDKVLRQENVIQAFSRTNRIFGQDKPFGLIYYYRKPHTMKRNIDEAVEMYSGGNPAGVFVDKLEGNLEKMDDVFADISALFSSEDIPDFSRLPASEPACAKFAQLFNVFSGLLEMVKVQDFSWERAACGDVDVSFDEKTYLTLLQRYKDIPKRPRGEDGDEPPYDIDSYITEMDTGRIDSEYIESRFRRYLKLRRDEESVQRVEKAMEELSRSFSLLPMEEQRYAEMVMNDIQLGNLVPDPDKTIHDYVSGYMRNAEDDRIRRFAQTFGLDEGKLREMVRLRVTDDNINEFGRLDELKATMDMEKAAAYFGSQTGERLSALKVNARFDNLLREFVLRGGFEI